MEDERVHMRVSERTTIPVEHTEIHPEPWYGGTTRNPGTAIRRMSWGAVFAGVAVTLVTQLLLSLLGIGIGASTIDPLQEQDPASGLATGAGIWFVVSSLLSLFAGGWVAGRMASIPRSLDSGLHGILTWSVATLLLFYFLTSTIGGIIGGTFRVLGSGLSTAAAGAATAAPGLAGAARDELQERGLEVDVSGIRREIETLLRQTGAPELQPDALRSQAETAVDQTQDAARRAAANPGGADHTISGLLERLGRAGQQAMNAADREALVNVIVARTGRSRAEAEQTVASYERSYQDLRARYEQTRAEAEQKAREAGDRAASATTTAAFSGFVALLLSACSAALGGWLATPRAELRTTASTV